MLQKKFFYAFTYCCILSLTAAFASNPWLNKPLRFANPDSVLVWGYEGRDCRSIALKGFPNATVYPIYLTQKEWKTRKDIFSEWLSYEKNVEWKATSHEHVAANSMLSIAKHLTQAAQLFRMQGNACYADYIEHTLFNDVMHNLNDSLQAQGTIDRQIAANLLFTLPSFIYATSSDGDVYVNIYTNSTAFLTAGETHFTIDQITNMPLDGRVKLRLNKLKTGTRLRLHLRIPEWLNMRRETKYYYLASDSITPSLFVNGHEIEPLDIDEKGYVTIDREWQALDEVYFDIPLQAQYVVENKRNTDYAFTIHENIGLQFGPLFYHVNTKGLHAHKEWGITMANKTSATGFPVLRLQLCENEGGGKKCNSKSSIYEVFPYAEGENIIRNNK